MTAPAFAPAAPESSNLTAQADTMEHTIRASLHQSLGTPDTPTNPEDAESAAIEQPDGAPKRDPKTGKFVAKPEGGAAEVPEGVSPETEPEIVIPDGYVAAQPLPEEKTKGFQVEDAEGEIQAPDLTWKFNAGGKAREMDTPTLIQFAQMGVYNHDLQQRAITTEQQNHQLHGQMAQVQQEVAQQRAEIERLLTDPNYLVAAIQRYEAENTPQARADRERQKIEQERRQFQLERMAQQADSFLDNEIAPAVDMMLGQLTTVSQEEVAARLFVIGDRYRMDGVLHPDGYQPIRQALVNDILPWAQQLHASRVADRQKPAQDAEAAKAAAKKAADDARARAQRARRTGVTPLRPGNQPVTGSPNAKPTVKNQKGAEEAVISQTLASYRHAG